MEFKLMVELFILSYTLVLLLLTGNDMPTQLDILQERRTYRSPLSFHDLILLVLIGNHMPAISHIGQKCCTYTLIRQWLNSTCAHWESHASYTGHCTRVVGGPWSPLYADDLILLVLTGNDMPALDHLYNITLIRWWFISTCAHLQWYASFILTST